MQTFPHVRTFQLTLVGCWDCCSEFVVKGHWSLEVGQGDRGIHVIPAHKMYSLKPQNTALHLCHHLIGENLVLLSFPVPTSHSTLSIGSIGCTEHGSQAQQCCKKGQEGKNQCQCLWLARLQESTIQHKQVFLFFHEVKHFLDQALKNLLLSFKEQVAITAVFRHTVVFDTNRWLSLLF